MMTIIACFIQTPQLVVVLLCPEISVLVRLPACLPFPFPPPRRLSPPWLWPPRRPCPPSQVVTNLEPPWLAVPVGDSPSIARVSTARLERSKKLPRVRNSNLFSCVHSLFLLLLQCCYFGWVFPLLRIRMCGNVVFPALQTFDCYPRSMLCGSD